MFYHILHNNIKYTLTMELIYNEYYLCQGCDVTIYCQRSLSATVPNYMAIAVAIAGSDRHVYGV